jgi:hypothetical protein
MRYNHVFSVLPRRKERMPRNAFKKTSCVISAASLDSVTIPDTRLYTDPE